ncbi:MAG: cytochrome d ubiquinol oxidase subunit II [Burkholderiaceae bacterium]
MQIDLVPVWTVIIGVGVFMYVLLDGFDLGVGMLFPFAPNDDARSTIMGSVAPIWDGNETWLVLGGAGLLAAFPGAFVIIFPALYFPVLLMLLGLIFRGVAFEFRLKSSTYRYWWNAAFAGGSAVATFFQGVVLGQFVVGFNVKNGLFGGTPWDWVHPFILLTGLGLMAGYLLLGATWLVIKTEGPLQDWSKRMARLSLLGTLAFIAMVSIVTPFIDRNVVERWFSWPNIAFLAPIPLLTAGTAWLLWRWLRRDVPARDAHPFLAAMVLFALCYLGLGISLFPYVVPHQLTLWDAAATPKTQAFLLIGTLFILPVIFMYTGWSYWVFRGKVREDLGYH